MNLNWTMLGQSITFIVFVAACWKWIWPVLIDAMRERQEVIAAGLASAERASKDLELAQERATDQMKEARAEAAALIEQARNRANQMIEDAKNDAREEGERVKEAAKGEIEQEVNRAKETLRSEVAALAVIGAERVLGETVDATRHSQLLEQLAAEL